MFQTYFFWSSSTNDEFLLAINIAGICLSWLTIISIAHTPIYNDIKSNSKVAANEYTNILISLMLGIGLVVCILLIINARYVINVATVGLDLKAISNTSIAFNYILIGLVIFAVNRVIISELNCDDRIVFTTISELVYSLTLILCVVASGISSKPFYLYCSYLFAAFFQVLVLFIF